MSGYLTTYNERSWAIDLIGFIKHNCTISNRTIKDAGGEQTIKTEGGSLFPDVLLFGDRSTARILQGWELKMPDTNIDDTDMYDNAVIKANALGLDSFILWNVSHAKLYVRNSTSNFFNLKKDWTDLKDITSRKSVLPNRDRWENLASKILSYLNDLFDSGSLEGRQFIDAYRSGGVTALIMENSKEVSRNLENVAHRNNHFRSEITLWWDKYQAEYAVGKMYDVLAQVIISNWVGKILFAHILREKDIRARKVADIVNETTPLQALDLFKKLSAECNFWTIFTDSLGLKEITEKAWSQLKQFNYFLSDLRIGSVDQSQLSGILEATVEVTTRKLRGQYPTPIELARLLIHLCIRNTIEDRVLDPCCGSGTIARAALEQKLLAGVPSKQAASLVFAGDQDPQAVQIATFALTRPNLMNVPLRIFQRDAFTLYPETKLDFRNPVDGTLFSEDLGLFNSIVSNLPFVAQAGRKQYGNALNRVTVSMGASNRFTKRADIAAYLPFALYPLLEDKGRLGIIITNSWLGTDWGDDFYNLLCKYYNLRSVITSGAGRWFQNSEVVTNILILEKKITQDQKNGDINFIVLTRPLEEMADEEAIRITSAQIELGQSQNETMTIRSVSSDLLERFRILGLGGNAQFVNCSWILKVPLVPIKKIFSLQRGERRGKNDFFYPKPGHKIEKEYIKPLAKSPSDFKFLTTSAIKEAFCCSISEEELETLGHFGALNWINRFKTTETIKKLETKNKFWYEMDADILTELVMFINYGDRLFVGRINPPAFADQRLVSLKPLKSIDIELYHSLMNSTIAMFILEGMGFGRGLGALDLSKNRIENYMHILDASLLDKTAKERIKSAFEPLTKRKILSVADELEQKDRQLFDEVIIDSFQLDVKRQDIYDSLLSLVEIRRTATD